MDEIKPGRYRHFKGGEIEFVSMATHSETGERMVVYRKASDHSNVWVRPARMWNDTVSYNGVTYRRFTYIGK